MPESCGWSTWLICISHEACRPWFSVIPPQEMLGRNHYEGKRCWRIFDIFGHSHKIFYSTVVNHIRIPGVSWFPCNWVSAQWSCQVLSECSCTNSAITMPGIATHHGPTIPFQPTKKIIKKNSLLRLSDWKFVFGTWTSTSTAWHLGSWFHAASAEFWFTPFDN